MKFYLHFEPPAASDQPSFTAIVTHDPAGPKVPTVSDVLDDFSGRYARKHGSILPVSRLTLLTADGAACHPHRSAALSVKTGDDVFVVDADGSFYIRDVPEGVRANISPDGRQAWDITHGLAASVSWIDWVAENEMLAMAHEDGGSAIYELEPESGGRTSSLPDAHDPRCVNRL